MKVKNLIEELQTLDPESDADAWIKGRGNYKIESLPFIEAGKAYQIICKFLGKKPYSANTADMNGKKYGYRNVIWAVDVDQGIKVAFELQRNNITQFKITEYGWLSIHMDEDTFLSSFEGDNPDVWAKKNAKRLQGVMASMQSRAKKEMERDLERRAHYAQMAENNRKWQEEHEKQKKEAERLQELGAKYAKKQEELNQIKHDDVVNITRSIQVEDQGD